MASKRRSPRLHPAADVPKRSRAASATSVAPRAPIDALPLDLLAVIFAYAPYAARLRAISLVCKRWRTAALRSSKGYVAGIRRGDPRSKMLASALTLFPSLTHLDVRDKIPFFALPTTLRSLSLWPSYLEASVEEEARGGTTYLSQHFPNLTVVDSDAVGLLYGGRAPTVSLDPLVSFLRAHSTQISKLTVGALHGSIARDVAALPWPKLRKLQCDAATLSLWSPPPALVELELLLISDGDDFMAVAEHWLPMLTDVYIPSGITKPVVLDRIRRCPALRSLSTDEDLPRDCLERGIGSDLFRRVLDNITIAGAQDWEWVCQFKAVRRLDFRSPLVAPPTPLALPTLEDVSIGNDADNLASPFATLAFAIQLLRACPTIKFMEVVLSYFEDKPEEVDAPALVRQIEELVVQGVAGGLRSLEFSVDAELNFGCEVPRAAQLGWLYITGLPTPFEESSSEADEDALSE